MKSEVHKIKSEKLKPLVQYILYNRHNEDFIHSEVSFPNTNICLGISKENILSPEGGTFVSKKNKSNNIFAYTTGLYTNPHEFKVSKTWDEICIDFHPCGYFHFFKLPSKPKIIEEDFASSFFSGDELSQFHHVFEETNLAKRSIAIEAFLLSKLKTFDKDNLQLAISYIHSMEGLISVKEVLKHTQCSERKMYKLFMDHFGITPRWYIRILKIRRAINLVMHNPLLSLTEVAYRCGYSDQSHFIKEAKTMCNVLPKTFRGNLVAIGNEVIVSRC